MKDEIKYLIHKLFIYKKVDTSNPSIIACLTNLLLMYYPDFNKEDISKMMLKVYGLSYYNDQISLDLTGLNHFLLDSNDYNSLYLAIKKSLTCSDSFEP